MWSAEFAYGGKMYIPDDQDPEDRMYVVVEPVRIGVVREYTVSIVVHEAPGEERVRPMPGVRLGLMMVMGLVAPGVRVAVGQGQIQNLN